MEYRLDDNGGHALIMILHEAGFDDRLVHHYRFYWQIVSSASHDRSATRGTCLVRHHHTCRLRIAYTTCSVSAIRMFAVLTCTLSRLNEVIAVL